MKDCVHINNDRNINKRNASVDNKGTKCYVEDAKTDKYVDNTYDWNYYDDIERKVNIVTLIVFAPYPVSGRMKI